MKLVKRDIQNKNDIESFVNGFYAKARNDESLSPIFMSRIADSEWPAHFERMYAFWNAILFAETGFQGNPMQKHMQLPIDESHFDRWLFLFRQTIDENFSGPKAEEAKQRAASIAGIMNFKIESLRGK
jgi:hemoglobin